MAFVVNEGTLAQAVHSLFPASRLVTDAAYDHVLEGRRVRGV